MWWKFIPAAIFVGAVASTNVRYALTLGDDWSACAIFVAYSVAATLGTALGPHYAADNWNSCRRLACMAALVWFAGSLTYDVYSTKGFAAREHLVAEGTTTEAKRKHDTAQAEVDRLKKDLTSYASAGDATVAKTEADSLQAQLNEIDQQPGVIYNDAPCVRSSSDRLRELCSKRAGIAAALAKAHTATATAAAKLRISRDLAKAERLLDANPPPKPSDSRAAAAVEWLPIGLALMAAVSVFAVPAAQTSAPAPPALPSRSGQAADQPSAAAPRRRRNQAGKAAVAAAITQLSSNPVKGLVVDRNGFIRGSQRSFARAAGYGTNVAGFNRDLRAAADEGELELETGAGGTAVRPKQA